MAIVGENKTFPIGDLKFDPRNARRHSERNIKSIMQSLREFGQHAPLIVRVPDNIVIVGNGRLEAMQRLGWKTAWVVFVDDDDEQAVRRALLDNRTAELADWDKKDLDRLLKEIDGFDIIGFEDFDTFFDDEGLVEDFESVETNETRVHRGEIWRLGDHLLVCDSSLDADWDKILQGKKINLLLTDPPYDLEDDFIGKVLPYVDGSIVVMGADRQIVNWVSNYKEYFKRFFVVVHRNIGFLPSGSRPLNCHTLFAHFLVSNRAPHYNFRGVSSVIECPNHRGGYGFRHAKNPDIFMPFLHSMSKPGDIVVDMFGGAGTVLMCCEGKGRRNITFEIEPALCSLIVNRWEAYTGKSAEVIL